MGLAAGLRFGEKYSIKPFVGVQNYYEKQGTYKVYGFESDKYSNYALNGVLGVEARAKIGEQSFIYARVSDELNFLNTQKDLFLRDRSAAAAAAASGSAAAAADAAASGSAAATEYVLKYKTKAIKYHPRGLGRANFCHK